VLDGEAVAYDRATGRLLPFQVLSTRSRKDATLDSIKVQVIYIAFDLLYLNGESLLHKSLAERRAALRGAFRRVPDRFDFAVSREGTDTEEIGAFLTEAVKGGCEGLMVKTLEGADSVYEPSKRSLNWLKLKKDYMDGLADSLDLVPVAAWFGKGKRTGVYGAYLLACYDADADEYQTVCKVGTGFSEEALESLTQGLGARGCTRDTKPRNVAVSDTLARDVDVWFVPEESQVWEVRAADLSISPVHMGGVGKVDASRGIGLRFPRFLHLRQDKAPADATTADAVVAMYRAQATVKGGADEDEDE
jgi:DNA ligase-1